MNRTIKFFKRLLSWYVMSCLLLAGATVELAAQSNNRGSNISPNGNTYAVVIGISNYQSKGIRKLRFANRDAEEFAGYLQSVNVPAANIRLLTDSLATTAAIYGALDWLLETCGENDVVYFYFSGHGDMENTTIYKLGFLLAQNTPRNNFINNALRIEDLNNVANTLSVENKAKVILITDACHSGKLTGAENKGKFLVGEQLRKAQRNEIRITSCGADELSAENEEWGGGRGVFSYYLVNGLKGLAEKQTDGFITLQEIKTFMDSSFANDAVLAKEKHKQNPVIPVSGSNAGFRLAKLDTSLLNKAIAQVTSDMVLQRSADEAGMGADEMLSLNPVDYFFIQLKEKFTDKSFDFIALDKLDAASIPKAIIGQVYDNPEFPSISRDKLAALENTIRDNKQERERFSNQMLVLLHDRVQDIINLYLEGDAAELERRRYYNLKSSGYDVYPPMLSVALKLAGPENLLRHILQVNLFYLTGLANRIRIPMVKDPAPLLATAMTNLQKAYAIEKEAPYILNELGILYRMKKQYREALDLYKKAAELSSEWALPWANMAAVYAETGQYEEGFAAAGKAKELDPAFQNPYVNSGILYEKTENYLMAEEEFRKSIRINTRHYLPFEGLGNVYMKTARYALADSFFFESDLRKRGYNLLLVDVAASMVLDDMNVMAPAPCFFNRDEIGKNDIMGNFAMGILSLESEDTVEAEKRFKHVIAIDPSNPLAFHYLGKILYAGQRWSEADIIFKYALQYHMDPTAFSRYTDSLMKLFPAYDDQHCVVIYFKKSYYDRIEDRYYLGTAYERWNHFEEAEKQFRLIISDTPSHKGGYYKLWNLLEKTGRYKDAEDAVRNYSRADPMQSNDELNGFYRRMMDRFPEKAEWYYKGGNFLYQLAAAAPDDYLLDKKYIEADTWLEKYADKGTYIAPSVYPLGEYLPGTREDVQGWSTITFPRTDAISFFQKAEKWVQEPEILAEINEKTGDLYVWQGLPGNATPHYKQAVELFPDNANTRIKLLDTYVYGYRFKEAVEQLDSLQQRKEINFPKMLQMAEYCAYAHRFPDAASLLKTAESIHPYRIPEIINLNGRLKMLMKQPAKAIPFYSDYLSIYPDDAESMYNLAKLHAQMGDIKGAWKWLESSLQKGFRYGFVLREEKIWDRYRPIPKWQQLMKAYEMKKYSEKRENYDKF